MTPVAEAYYRADEIEKANLIMVRLMEIYESDLSFYLSLSRKQAKKIKAETERAMSVFPRLIQIARDYKQDDLHTQLKEKFTIFQTDYQHIQTPPAGSPGRRL